MKILNTKMCSLTNICNKKETNSIHNFFNMKILNSKMCSLANICKMKETNSIL